MGTLITFLNPLQCSIFQPIYAECILFPYHTNWTISEEPNEIQNRPSEKEMKYFLETIICVYNGPSLRNCIKP